MGKVSRKEEVIQYLLNHIKENALKEGDSLPTQVELVERLGISRTAVREAVKELEGKDLIQVVNGRGMFVTAQKSDHILSGMALEKKKESLLEVIEARWALENQVIRNIIEHVPSEKVKELTPLVTALMEKYQAHELQNNIDKNFHQALYNLCTNEVLKKLMTSMGYLMEELWDFPLGIQSPFTETIPYHEKMYMAILNKDVFRALHYNDTIFIMMMDEIKLA